MGRVAWPRNSLCKGPEVGQEWTSRGREGLARAPWPCLCELSQTVSSHPGVLGSVGGGECRGGGLASQWRTIWRKSAASWVDRWRLLEYSRGVLTWPSGWSRTRGGGCRLETRPWHLLGFLISVRFPLPSLPFQ